MWQGSAWVKVPADPSLPETLDLTESVLRVFRTEEAKENLQLTYISLLIVQHNLINSISHPPEDYGPTLLTLPSGSYKAGNAANKSCSDRVRERPSHLAVFPNALLQGLSGDSDRF